MLRLKTLFSRSNLAVVVAGASMASTGAFAADAGPDFSSLITGLAAGGVITSIVAMGVIKIGPNFAKWGTNKLVGFFR